MNQSYTSQVLKTLARDLDSHWLTTDISDRFYSETRQLARKSVLVIPEHLQNEEQTPVYVLPEAAILEGFHGAEKYDGNIHGCMK